MSYGRISFTSSFGSRMSVDVAMLASSDRLVITELAPRGEGVSLKQPYPHQ